MGKAALPYQISGRAVAAAPPKLAAQNSFVPPTNESHAHVRNTAKPQDMLLIQGAPDFHGHIAIFQRSSRHRATDDETRPPEIFQSPGRAVLPRRPDFSNLSPSGLS